MAFQTSIDPGANLLRRDAAYPTLLMAFDAAGTEVKCIHCDASALMLYQVDDDTPIGAFGLKVGPIGVAQTLNADELRSLASQMLRVADVLDGGKGRQ